MFRHSRASFPVLCALAFAICFQFVAAQEVIRIEPEHPPEPPKVPDSKSGSPYNLKPPVSPFFPTKPVKPIGVPFEDQAGRLGSKISLSDGHRLGHMSGTPPPLHIDWQKFKVADGVSGYRAVVISGDGSQASNTHLTQKELEDLFSSDRPIVNSGDVPYGSAWQNVISGHESKTITHEKGSANSDLLSITLATNLGDTSLDPAKTKIFNALPLGTGELELQHMGITAGAPEQWAEANREISHASQGFQSSIATKQSLLEELRTGSSDVVVIYAHFDGNALHFPGYPVETLSVDEIAQIHRVGDPSTSGRVIILAACSTAAVPSGGQARSLVQTLLANGIARTVFATDRPFNAWNIIPLMDKLKSKTIREAAGQLRQHVEIDPPDPWFDELGSGMKKEASFRE